MVNHMEHWRINPKWPPSPGEDLLSFARPTHGGIHSGSDTRQS